MYASLRASKTRKGLFGGFYVASNHRGNDMLSDALDTARNTKPDLLWSFVGTFSNDPVRTVLGLVEDPEAVIRDTQRFSDEIRWNHDFSDPVRLQAHRSYAEMLGRSLFVACPRGRGASSIRLFEAMQAGRCPVVISDEWMPPPFVDWSTCSIRIAEKDVGRLPQILRSHRGQAAGLGEAARCAWDEHFSPARQLATLTRTAFLTEASLSSDERFALGASAILGQESARIAYRRVRAHARLLACRSSWSVGGARPTET
jgi:Exostosin family